MKHTKALQRRSSYSRPQRYVDGNSNPARVVDHLRCGNGHAAKANRWPACASTRIFSMPQVAATAIPFLDER
jgi:hypothetical protein